VPGPIDLTQVRTFVHLYETRSVTATADALRVSQPTVSYTLGKMRRRFGDDLFVRTARGLAPTGAADQLYEPLRAALGEIDRAVSAAEVFEPSITGREFTVMLSDFGELSFLPLIVPLLQQHAPHARLRVRPLVLDAAGELLVSGEVDLVITSGGIESDRLTRQPFMTMDYAALVAAEHPRIRGNRLTATAFTREHYVNVKGTAGHQGPVNLLKAQNLEDRVELQLTSYTAVPYVVADSRLIAIVPRHIGTIFQARFSVRVVDLPWRIEPIRVAAYTRRTATEPQRWFLDLVVGRLSTKRLR
jgi:DNA-binding transcriptional LysR family regulator